VRRGEVGRLRLEDVCRTKRAAIALLEQSVRDRALESGVAALAPGKREDDANAGMMQTRGAE
jgi:hypothetical protein